MRIIRTIILYYSTIKLPIILIWKRSKTAVMPIMRIIRIIRIMQVPLFHHVHLKHMNGNGSC